MMQSEKNIFEKLFKLTDNKTNIKTEILSGVTTFIAMSYIIFVNPNILSHAGIPIEAAFAATVWATVIGCLLMGLWANFPVAVAPGMGLNAFFAYYVCGTLGLHWTVALGAVFISGVVFVILTVTRLRRLIIEAVPKNLKSAIVVGIGLFIAFIGLQGSGIIIKNEATLVNLGNMLSPTPLLTIFGLIFTAVLMIRGIWGNILIGILATTLLGMLIGACPVPESLDKVISFNLPSLSETFMKLDILAALEYGVLSIIFTFTIVELFDNMGTLIGISRKANLMDKDGNIKNLDKALITDSTGTIISSFLGTCTITSYIESAAGVAQGGRTGLTAVVVGILFLVSLVFAPLVQFIPVFATAPALILVGFFMMLEIKSIKFDDFTEGLPAFLLIIMMPLTYSIASGFAFGFVSYALLKSLSGQVRQVSLIMWFIVLVFIINFILRGH